MGMTSAEVMPLEKKERCPSLCFCLVYFYFYLSLQELSPPSKPPLACENLPNFAVGVSNETSERQRRVFPVYFSCLARCS